MTGRAGEVRHLYVHLPFCAHRCGYCDFVTVLGRAREHGAYVDAVLAELALERGVLADPLETVYLGGGTPTFTEPDSLERLLRSLPAAREVTVEANPETLTADLASLLRDAGVNRVSLGAQSFRAELLSVLERRASPETVRQAVYLLRDAGFDNISLDLLYGIPGQGPAELDGDLADALALEPEHLSWYELEAKPGTRFTHRHGAELERQFEEMEGYFERVVERLTEAGYRWYETANFCLEPRSSGGRDLRAVHNLGYWLGRDYLGLGIGAVSTVRGVRWRNLPSLVRYRAALGGDARPPREYEVLSENVRSRERLLLGLRLDEPLPMSEVAGVLDEDAAARLVAGGLVDLGTEGRERVIRLTQRGRSLGGGVTAELMRLSPR